MAGCTAESSPSLTKANCEIADELAQADTDYAAGNTISGEDVRERYGLGRLDRNR
jgi:hypothetical protein